MYYDNNYQTYDDESGFSFGIMFCTSIIIISIVLGIWFYYAIQYRYSSDRIAGKLRKKYKKEFADNQTLIVSDGKFIDTAKTRVSARMTIQDKNIEGSNKSSEVFSLPVKECSPVDNTCVEL